MLKNSKKTVKKAYDKLDIKVGYDQKNSFVYTSVKFGESEEPVRQFVRIGERELTFLTLSPKSVGSSEIDSVCNEILGLNYNMIMGSFDIDREDGEVHFRSTVALDGSKASTEVVKRHILLGFSSIRQFQKEVWQKHCGSDGKNDRRDEGKDPMFK